jgi:hypothetical protein
MAQEKSQNSFKEKLEGQVNISFLIQLEQVQGKHIEYSKLYVIIRDGKNEVDYQHLNPQDLDVIKILQKIAKLYQISQTVDNEKIVLGTREEILKLVALLLWKIS